MTFTIDQSAEIFPFLFLAFWSFGFDALFKSFASAFALMTLFNLHSNSVQQMVGPKCDDVSSVFPMIVKYQTTKTE